MTQDISEDEIHAVALRLGIPQHKLERRRNKHWINAERAWHEVTGRRKFQTMKARFLELADNAKMIKRSKGVAH